jgi:hypothetical protein
MEAQVRPSSSKTQVSCKDVEDILHPPHAVQAVEGGDKKQASVADLTRRMLLRRKETTLAAKPGKEGWARRSQAICDVWRQSVQHEAC